MTRRDPAELRVGDRVVTSHGVETITAPTCDNAGYGHLIFTDQAAIPVRPGETVEVLR